MLASCLSVSCHRFVEGGYNHTTQIKGLMDLIGRVANYTNSKEIVII